MDINLSKSPIPIIWLDTSVIISLKNLRRDKNLNTRNADRYNKLYEIIVSHVKNKKLICPAGDQQEEYDFGTDGNECRLIQDSLSFGLSFLYRSSIQLRQISDFARAYVDGKDQVILSHKDAFERDPIHQLAGNGPLVSVHLALPKEVIDKFRSDHIKAIDATENLRRYNIGQGISFQQQLAKEYNGRVEAAQVVARNWNQIIVEKKTPTFDDIAQLQALDSFLSSCNITGSVERALEFFGSNTYKSIPYIDISCSLYAERVTGTTPIESGDYMDIEQVATLLPYCDMLVTDKKMKNRIRKFGFDSKYRTKVYSMSDSDQLIDDLKAI
jgi:hypothetical protein